MRRNNKSQRWRQGAGLFILTILIGSGIAEPLRAVAGDKPQPIASIRFEGLKITSEDFLLREISSRVGQPFSPKQLQEDLRRLENLRLFTRVTPQIQRTSEDGISLIFCAVEDIFWLPIPYLARKDNFGYSVGLSFRHWNVGGRKQTLAFKGMLGGARGLEGSYTSELTYSRRLAFALAFADVKSARALWGDGKRDKLASFSFKWRLGAQNQNYGVLNFLSAGIEFRSAYFNGQNIALSSNGKDMIVALTFFYTYNNCDLFINPRRGHVLELGLRSWNANPYRHFDSFLFRYTKYAALTKHLVLAANGSFEGCPRGVPRYAFSFLDERNFRGCTYGEYYGESLLINNYEMRWLPGKKWRFWKIYFEPVAALFADFALIGPHDRFFKGRIHQSFGLSLGLITPYVAPFLNISLNEKKKITLCLSLSGWLF